MDPHQTAETFHTIEPWLFWLVAGITGVCAIATVINQNIVRAATWLLFTLAGTSAIFFLLGADLVGATQLLVYVGGTLVLVVFGVMLTAQGPFISMKTSGAEWAISIVAGMLLMGVLTTAIVAPAKQPRIRQAEVDAKNGMVRLNYVTPDVNKFAPKLSRAEREAKAAKPAPRPTKAGTVVDLPGGKKGVPPASIPVERPEPLDPATSAQSATLGQGFLGVGVGPAHPSDRSSVVRTSYLLPFEIVSIHLLVVLIGAAYLARAKRRRGAEA